VYSDQNEQRYAKTSREQQAHFENSKEKIVVRLTG